MTSDHSQNKIQNPSHGPQDLPWPHPDPLLNSHPPGSLSFTESLLPQEHGRSPPRQGLCTCYFLSLEGSFPTYLQDSPSLHVGCCGHVTSSEMPSFTTSSKTATSSSPMASLFSPFPQSICHHLTLYNGLFMCLSLSMSPPTTLFPMEPTLPGTALAS